MAQRLDLPGFYVEPYERNLPIFPDDMPETVRLPGENRAWIIGNGPSLRAEDLEALHDRGEFCIGMNRIQLIYEKTNWRPSVYCLADTRKNVSWRQDVLFHVEQGYPCHVKNLILNALTPHFDGGLGAWIDQPWAVNVVPLIECMHNYIDHRPPTKWHYPHPCCFQGSMSTSIQIAAFLGFKNIILLGVDHSWKLREQVGDPDPNHYDPRYDGGLEHGVLNGIHIVNGLPFAAMNPFTIEKMVAEAIYAYRLAAREASALGISIVNASRTSDLHTFPKASFEEFLGEV
jgi:hypothetical protein